MIKYLIIENLFSVIMYEPIKTFQNSSKGDGKLEKWKKITAYGMHFISIIIILWLSSVIISPNVRFDNENVTAIDHEWTAVYRGNSETVSLPADVDANAGETVSFSTTLTQQDVYVNTIMVKALHSYIKVYLDDSCIGSFGYDHKTPFGNAPYAGYLTARLPTDWQGKKLTIEVIGYYDNYSGILNTVYGGTKNSLVFMIFEQCTPSLLINFSIIILSVFLLVTSFFYRWPGLMIQLRAISIFSIITGAWLILESGGYQLFWGYAPMVSNTIFILFSLLPIAAIRFIQTYKAFKSNKLITCLYILSLVNFVVIHILQFTRTADYIQTITGSHVIIVLLFASIVWKFIRTLIHHKKLEDPQLYIACIVFAVFGCVDIFRFYMGNPLANSVMFSQIGLALFVLVLMFSAISNIVVDRENSMKKDVMQHLAFTDLLTNLPNRNAFEQRMEIYRSEDSEQHPIIILADLNDLKQINDTLGHKMGDEAIIRTGHILRENFPENAEVYRIGGDEFCIISESMDEIQAEEYIKKSKESLSELKERFKTDISASFGFCLESGQGADNAFSAADKDMYKNKLFSKKQSYL